MTGKHRAGVGDLVRDTERSRVGVLTAVQGGTPSLRPRYGGGIDDQRSAQRSTIELVARRSTWESG
ncbi:hypothetical protein AB0E08_43410 [Streptomyces sp. NPDC048281]|uniref:hypothetical protein n=1 Tax=Streptomyces sp. NPDC048281 TaxID=3154715 RepID=UPI00343A9C28